MISLLAITAKFSTYYTPTISEFRHIVRRQLHAADGDPRDIGGEWRLGLAQHTVREGIIDRIDAQPMMPIAA